MPPPYRQNCYYICCISVLTRVNLLLHQIHCINKRVRPPAQWCTVLYLLGDFVLLLASERALRLVGGRGADWTAAGRACVRLHRPAEDAHHRRLLLLPALLSQTQTLPLLTGYEAVVTGLCSYFCWGRGAN